MNHHVFAIGHVSFVPENHMAYAFVWMVTIHHQRQCVFAQRVQMLSPFGVVIFLIQEDVRIQEHLGKIQKFPKAGHHQRLPIFGEQCSKCMVLLRDDFPLKSADNFGLVSYFMT